MSANETRDSNARLELNARGHAHNPDLERVADMFHTDRAAWERLSPHTKSAGQVYAEMREHHRRAVQAGVIKGNTDAD
jgi:hypothetical protein